MNHHDVKFEQLVEQADEWLVKLRSSDVSEEDKFQFSLWLNTSNDHARAFDDALNIWNQMAKVEYLPEVQRSHAQSLAPKSKRAWYSIPLIQMGVAASLLAGVLSFGWLQQSQQPAMVSEYLTSAGELREIVLEDGSKVTLNTRTQLRVSYSDAQRSLRLLDGEAYFVVAKDPSRPFVVDVGAGTVTAVGTEFNIHKSELSTQIVITEGIVDVSEKKDAYVNYPKTERVYADSLIGFDKFGMTKVSRANSEATLAWQQQQLVFDNAPLSEVLSELNRYLEKPVGTEHQSLADTHVSGTFDVSQPDVMLSTLMNLFHIKDSVQSPGTLFIESATSY